MSQITLEQKY